MTTDRLAELRAVAGTVSRETLERLEAFESEFRRWASRINLAAPSTLNDLWRRHILDSAQLSTIESDAIKWLDLGSGGGFPGLVMAILMVDRPGGRVELVESNQKKAAFLRHVIGTLSLPATVHICRIEQAWERVAMPEVVTARALAPLGSLLRLSSLWLEQGARGLFHKGRDYREEVAESHDAWRYDLVEHVSKIDRQSRILAISGLAPVGKTASVNQTQS